MTSSVSLSTSPLKLSRCSLTYFWNWYTLLGTYPRLCNLNCWHRNAYNSTVCLLTLGEPAAITLSLFSFSPFWLTMHRCTCVLVCVHVGSHVYIKRPQGLVSSQQFSTLSTEAGPLTEPRACVLLPWLSRLALNSFFLDWNYRRASTSTQILCGSWGCKLEAPSSTQVIYALSHLSNLCFHLKFLNILLFFPRLDNDWSVRLLFFMYIKLLVWLLLWVSWLFISF